MRTTKHKSQKKVAKRIKEAIKKLKKRNKLIRMADKSKAGWKLVEEYLTDEIASGPEDGKKIKKCEKIALQKIADEKEKKKKQTNERNSKPSERFRNASQRKGKARENDICFRCGKKGHWGQDCWTYKKEDRYGRRERNY